MPKKVKAGQMWAALPFFCRRKRIPADQNALKRRRFFGGRACGRRQISAKIHRSVCKYVFTSRLRGTQITKT
jgi:hypothetical protein